MSTGEIIHFSEAEIHGEFATLTIGMVQDDRNYRINDLEPYCFERGIEVRIANVIWCADAPHGS